jgi:hypothetical protein
LGKSRVRGRCNMGVSLHKLWRGLLDRSTLSTSTKSLIQVHTGAKLILELIVFFYGKRVFMFFSV